MLIHNYINTTSAPPRAQTHAHTPSRASSDMIAGLISADRRAEGNSAATQTAQLSGRTKSEGARVAEKEEGTV